MAIVYVQGPAGTVNNAAATTIAETYDSDNTAGNLLVLAVSWSGALTVVQSVTDTAGNTWTAAAGVYSIANTQGITIAYAPNCVAGANTVTVTFAAAQSFRRLALGEWSGADPLNPMDKFVGSVQDSTTSATDNITSGPDTTLTGGELIVGATQRDGTSFGGPIDAGTGFTTRSLLGTDELCLEDMIQLSAGTVEATFTYGVASAFVTYMVTFVDASEALALPELGMPPVGSH